jgi:hypothetical protein
MEYYSGVKNEVLLLTGKWMETEHTILSKTSQTKKDKYQHFLHMWKLWNHLCYHLCSDSFVLAMGIQPRASHMLGKCSNTNLSPQPQNIFLKKRRLRGGAGGGGWERGGGSNNVHTCE